MSTKTLSNSAAPDSELLPILSSRPCEFEHEHSIFEDPPPCSEEVCDKMLGCPHGKSVLILCSEIMAQVRGGIISENDGYSLIQELEATNSPLLHLDMTAKKDYDNRGQIEPDTAQGQVDIIEQRAIVARRLGFVVES